MPHADDARLRSRRSSPLLLTAFGAAGLFALLIAWIAVFGTAGDGRPEVTLPLKPAPGTTAEAPPTQQAASSPRLVNGNLVADPALLEDSPSGPLPRIGADGRRPMAAYARSFQPVANQPRIAIVLTGLGISGSETTQALTKLPAPVTLAFSPYGRSVQTLVDTARGKGHEVLIEVPMEPFDFPDSDPGPRTLIAAASKSENEQRLAWTLSRFTGYAGAVNSQGGRLLSEAAALEPVIAYLANRGVLWVDVSSTETSATLGVIARLKAAGVTGAMRIDAIQTPEAIDEKLLDLEALARQNGSAIGVASAYPVSIERIARWTARAERNGFSLAPVTATAPQRPRAQGGP